MRTVLCINYQQCIFHIIKDSDSKDKDIEKKRDKKDILIGNNKRYFNKKEIDLKV